jgi:hypothetical protein
VRALGWGVGLILVGLALAGVWVMVAGGYKQLWTALAADVQRAAAFGKPILVVRPVTATLIDVYAPGWLLPPGSTLEPAPEGGRQLRLAGGDPPGRRAWQQVSAQPGGLYTLVVAAQAALQGNGQATVALTCQDSGGAPLSTSTPEAALPNDGQWYGIKLAVLCPPATSHLAVILQATGSGSAAFRAVTLSEALPPAP